ncbi:RidA family protein [Sphingomonas bacterium]|uniref:RidA family protein n=1 Tax=Sphingomonas bacterium TaxID=1895847 RepID=UPI001576103D|nr:RidA family protein [Sphingomonas bacterium]
MKTGFTMLASAAALLPAAQAQAQAFERYSSPATPAGPALILQGAKVKAGSDILYLSGQLASPIDPSKPMRPGMTMADYGDTKTQTISTLNKIKTILASKGYAMSDIFKMTLFVAADPKLGKMDFAGVNEGFKQFFGTAENPNTVARSAIQVAALAGPNFLIEIEAIAAKTPGK